MQVLNTGISMPRLIDVCPNTVVKLATLPNDDTRQILHSLGLSSTQPFRICAVNHCCVIVQCGFTRIGIARDMAKTINVHLVE